MTMDPDVFMNQNVDEPLESVRTLCPEGEFKAHIDDFEFNTDTFRPVSFVSKKTGEQREATVLRLPFVIDDDEVKAKLGRDKVTVYFRDMWLDFKPGTQELDTGPNKNVDLGAIRKALGLTTGAVFAPLRGAGPIRVRVRHRSYDENDPEKKIAEVFRVTAW